jgi:hypothetical protein
MPKKDNVCSRILTPKQVGPICWFMATFVAMFYSQRSRKILLEASKGWDNKKRLFILLKHILDDKYLKTASRESEDYRKFSDNTFIDILKLLHQENKRTFMYNPTRNKGFTTHFYIGRLYNLLNIDYTIFEYDIETDFLTYSLLNEEYNDDIDVKIIQKYNRSKKQYEIIHPRFEIKSKSTLKKKIMKFSKFIKKPLLFFKNDRKRSMWFKDSPTTRFKDAQKRFENTPSILIVFVRNDTYNSNIYGEGVFYQRGNNKVNNRIDDIEIKKSIQSMDEQIFYRGYEYNLDSVILGDVGETVQYNPYHNIAGITCKKTRYVYNGWTRISMDPAMVNAKIARDIPCELMNHDWNMKDDVDYYLDTNNCQLALITEKTRNMELTFNFSKGYRTLIYVRKSNTKSKSSTSVSISPLSQNQMSSDISSSKKNTIIITERNIDLLNLIIGETSKIDKVKVILHDIKITHDILDILKFLEPSMITHFIIKNKGEYDANDKDVLFELLFMIEHMTNIKLLDLSGFDIDDSVYSYYDDIDNSTLYTTTFVKLFKSILLHSKKLKYLNFANNTISAKSYNEIFRLGNTKTKPNTTNAVMMITERRIKFNTSNCSTKSIDTLKKYNSPIQFYTYRPLMNYKNPDVDKQIKSIIQ